MRTLLPTCLICLLAPVPVALAQGNPPTPTAPSQANPLSAHSRLMYRGTKAILLRSAEKMPEEDYAFKPTDAVRTFGQIIQHAANSQYVFCSKVLGDSPAPKIDQTKTSKADLIAALKDACAYCDKAYDSLTDASAADMVKLFGNDTPRLGVLTVNTVHSVEHYGNLVTYLRLKNIVPPTSEPEFMQQLNK